MVKLSFASSRDSWVITRCLSFCLGVKLSSGSRRDGPVFDGEGADDVTVTCSHDRGHKAGRLGTQEIYLQEVRSLANHYNRSPALLAEERGRAISAGCS